MNELEMIIRAFSTGRNKQLSTLGKRVLNQAKRELTPRLPVGTVGALEAEAMLQSWVVCASSER
jgi:hypothetical protein